MTRAIKPDAATEADMQASAIRARARAEAAAQAAAEPQPLLDSERASDFVEGTDLSGPHQPRTGWTFTETVNGTVWRLAPIDAGAYAAFTRATAQSDRERKKLELDGLRLQAHGRALLRRFEQALEDEENRVTPSDSADEAQSAIEAHDALILANQEAQAALMPSLMNASRAILEHCLRDWVRPDYAPLNATTRAGLDNSRVTELVTCCVERFILGQSNARFR